MKKNLANRRSVVYIILGFIATAAIALMIPQKREPLQIIFTNDSHSQIEPLNGKGGYEARAYIIDSLRNINTNTILLDAGDFVQGTPYFNLYGGRAETLGYNLMGYDVMTLGNHEFDNGIDSLANLINMMDYKVVCANLDFGTTPLSNLVQPYTILQRKGWRVGVIGLSVNLDGLVLQSNYEGITYLDPIEEVNRYAKLLRNEKQCNLVIVLSHLGFNNDNDIADETLVGKIDNVDMILGGHTHSVTGVHMMPDANGDTIPVMQENKSGMKLYRMIVE